MILGKVTHAYYNWEVTVNDGTILFKCNLRPPEGSGILKMAREYDIPKTAREITFEGSYIRIDDGKQLIEFKLEGESCIVGDVWEDGECIDSIAMYDFWEDYVSQD